MMGRYLDGLKLEASLQLIFLESHKKHINGMYGILKEILHLENNFTLRNIKRVFVCFALLRCYVENYLRFSRFNSITIIIIES